MNKIIFDQLGKKTNAVWSLLLASGYLKVLETIPTENAAISVYRLVITNLEVKTMFEQMIKDWFEETPYFEDFCGCSL